MKKASLFLFLLVTALWFSFCKPDQAPAPAEIIADETPEALLAVMDSLPDAADFTPETILLPNGMSLKAYLEESDSVFAKAWFRSDDPYKNMTPGEAQVALIARLSAAALFYSHRPSFQYPQGNSNEPAQYGLAYSWGSKDTLRQVPPGGGSFCTQSVHGLDCSGFMHLIFKAAGIDIPKGNANLQRNIETLSKSIHDASPALASLQFEDLGKAPPASQLRIGDILWWDSGNDTANHIGIVLSNWNGKKAVFQSIGRNVNSTAQCAANLGLKRGPRPIEFDDNSGKSLKNHCYLIRAKTPLVCGCAGGSTLCNLPPSESLIKLALAGFNYKPGKGTKAEAKEILKALCADVQHEYTYPEGTISVCGVLPNGYEITLWTPSFALVNGYGVRYGKVSENHAYFGDNYIYFELIKP